ncbi:hypothetical protein GZH47_30395 [Paenibacillus rhizovicinus]|uniref:Uncharacterized protein n=1 Tax=Paenibacillus rhizovicinus TaxID=2704463 RepID=A0A6C0PCJ0_9BACL|nr:hypothetical protein [Paenibacillus rhizovicinus]QHW34682.1 hypothetical protein GZH47_30395 [Paenibacillus rhizovicinus]
MKNQLLAFKCPACKSIHDFDAGELKEVSGVEIQGVDWQIQWSDFGEEVPDLNERIWARSSVIPEAGTYRTVMVTHPFHLSVGERIWTLFQPPLSFFNGWDDYPEEINDSAMVNICFERILAQDEKAAWIVVQIENVVLVSEADQVLQRQESDATTANFDVFSHTQLYESAEWLYIVSSSEGDIGCWGLLKKQADHYKLILDGYWDFHRNTVNCMHIRMDEHAIQALMQRVQQQNDG